MGENIGWIYNKKYYYQLKGDENKGDLLHEQNRKLIGIVYDEFYQKQLIDERKVLLEKSGNFVGFDLRICYPGLITGIGMNHQTTIKWKRIVNGQSVEVPEYKLGMCFDHTTGMPLIPGSSVKGVLRSFFPILNQKENCDNYGEKCRYIACIIDRVTLIDEWENNKSEKIEQFKWKRIEDEYANSNKGNEESESMDSLIEKKGEELCYLCVQGEISETEFDQLTEKENLKELVEKDLKKKREENLKSFYDGCKGKDRRKIDEAAEKDYLSFIYNLWTEPLPDQPSSSNENIAPLLALEMFEGKKDGKILLSYSRDVFLDALIIKGGNGGKIFAKDYITPHDDELSNPIPICFMKIGPGVRIQFCFRLHDGILPKRIKLLLLKYLLCENGIGAKTNVGYGQLQRVTKSD